MPCPLTITAIRYKMIPPPITCHTASRLCLRRLSIFPPVSGCRDRTTPNATLHAPMHAGHAHSVYGKYTVHPIAAKYVSPHSTNIHP